MADIAVSDTAAMAIAQAITAQTTAMTAAITGAVASYTALHGPTAVNVAGMPAANGAVTAGALNDISMLLTSMLKEQKTLNANLQVLTTSLSAVSTTIATGVTTQQLAYIDQTKNNQFNQQTTNAALQRADLPPTVVAQGDLVEKVKGTVNDISNLQLQSQVATATTQGIVYVQGLTTKGLSWAFGEVSAYIASTGAARAVKGWWESIFPPAKEIMAEVNSVGRATFIGQVATKPLPIDAKNPGAWGAG